MYVHPGYDIINLIYIFDLKEGNIMSNKKVSVLLIGISGYGHTYLRELFNDQNETSYLVGAVDINPKRSDYYNEIIERGIPIYDSIEQFYSHHRADLAIISTPIHLHKQQSIYAMKHGSHVLCEKPMTANPDDISDMIQTRDATGKFLAIGFNWSFAPSVQQLKSDVLKGKFGKAKRLKSIVLWPRDEDYYNRSAWAGKTYSPEGDMIFDSVVNNATAHFLHHLFYVTGDTVETSANPTNLTAELYKVNDIETFDTCAVKITTQANIDILYIASHAVTENRRPHFVMEFEKGTVTYDPEVDSRGMVATLDDGTTIEYGDPELERNSKFPVCIEAILKGHDHILCGVEAATPHVQSIYAMHQSVPNVPKFPEHITKRDAEKKLNWIDGLDNLLQDCYEKWSIPSDLNVEWSQRGTTISIK